MLNVKIKRVVPDDGGLTWWFKIRKANIFAVRCVPRALAVKRPDYEFTTPLRWRLNVFASECGLVTTLCFDVSPVETQWTLGIIQLLFHSGTSCFSILNTERAVYPSFVDIKSVNEGVKRSVEYGVGRRECKQFLCFLVCDLKYKTFLRLRIPIPGLRDRIKRNEEWQINDP